MPRQVKPFLGQLGVKDYTTRQLEQIAAENGMAIVEIRHFPASSTKSRFTLCELDDVGVWLPLGKDWYEAKQTLELISIASECETTCVACDGLGCEYDSHPKTLSPLAIQNVSRALKKALTSAGLKSNLSKVRKNYGN